MGVTSHQLIYHRQRSLQKLKRERREEKKQKVKPTFDCYMPDKNQEWNVLVTTFSGRTLSVIVNPFDTIEQLRYKVAIKEDISQDQIMLMKNGTILTDGDTLEYWDIRDQSLIYMTFRLRGG